MVMGGWRSPITAEVVYGEAKGLDEVRIDGGDTYWLERRPSEGGRQVVVRYRRGDDAIEDVTPPAVNVRTRVHEYGGGSYAVREGVVWFVAFEDQRLYRHDPGTDPRPITPEPERPAGVRYADLEPTADGRWLVCVRETHHGDSAEEVVNEIVAVPADGEGGIEVLVSGRDFFASPRLSPDGRELAFVAWDHPNMPWDDTEVAVVGVADRAVTTEPERVCGGPAAGESVIAPGWSPEGRLHLISDRNGWWNLYRRDGDELTHLTPVQADLGQPMWLLGSTLYGFLDDGRIAVIATRQAEERPSLLDPSDAILAPLPVPHTDVRGLVTDGRSIAFAGASPTAPQEVVRLDPPDLSPRVLCRARDVPVGPEWISEGEAISFPTGDGEVAHGYLYRPHNPEVSPEPGERPPLIVTSHGGPTSHVAPALDLAIQFWTSRGFAVVDVNYRGSTGYGRDYRQALYGTWGLHDVEDCIAAARYLADRGEVDPERMAIRGGSASGYTTLCALTFHDVFAAGASYYGVADLGLLAEETHKFESRYLDRLIGPYPEEVATYRERSPIHNAEGLRCPVILLQGLEDRVVPPSQAETMIEALDEQGVPHAYVAFPEEDHGFRDADNLVRALHAELSFYAQVFGFAPADDIDPVEVVHLADRR
jgi:dipeptidyl aminopeptidase/acylaminoacyl peptidase